MRYESGFKPGLFEGKTFIVTGGGSGIGRCTAHELAALGASVALIRRTPDRLNRVKVEIEEDGGRASVHVCDIREESQVRATVDAVLRRHGRIDGLVNNAGGQYRAELKTISTKGFEAVERSNLTGGFIFMREVPLAAVMADPVAMPHHFIAGPTYGAMHEILMEYIAQTSRGATKPTVALVYTESEFGRDGIPASKARTEKLGIQIVTEIVTKASGMDIATEVARLRRAKPDIVIFQGYAVTPIPEFVRQMREAGLNSQIMGIIWSSDKPLLDARGAMNESYIGVVPYRHSYDTDSQMMTTMREYVARTRPEMTFISHFYVYAWLADMVFADIAERCIKAGKPLRLPHMKAALESMKNWDTGGLTGLLADLSRHQIASGCLYRLDTSAKRMEAASGWIRV